MGRAMFSKSLIEFSIDGWGCVPSLLLDLRPNYGGGNEENGDHLPKVPCTHCPLQCPQPCGRPPQTHASARDSGTFMSKSELVSCGSLLLSPGSWCAQGFVPALQESVSPVMWKSWNQIPLASKVKFPVGTQSLCPIHRLGNLLCVLELSQQCKNFFHIIVLQSSAQWLYDGVNGDLLQEGYILRC